MADIEIINPDALGKPLGQYSHMTRVKASEFLFIAGEVGVDRNGNVVGADDFDAQCVQTFANIEAALKSVDAGWGNIVQFTTYLVHSQDIAKFMKYRLREFPGCSPMVRGEGEGRAGQHGGAARLRIAAGRTKISASEVPVSGAHWPGRTGLSAVDHAHMRGDDAPAFGEFHPGLHLPADLAGRRGALIERRGHGEFAAEGRDHRRSSVRPRPPASARRGTP